MATRKGRNKKRREKRKVKREADWVAQRLITRTLKKFDLNGPNPFDEVLQVLNKRKLHNPQI